MKRLLILLIALTASATPVPVRAERLYVSGEFCQACWNAPPADACRFYDDGLHGDGAAGDQVYGATITADRPAHNYRWFIRTTNDSGSDTYGAIPFCWCTTPPVYMGVWTSGPGDIIQFRYDPRPPVAGWQGCGLVNDHGMPPDTQLDVTVDPNEEYGGAYGVFASNRTGTIWSSVIRITYTGTHRYVFTGRNYPVRFSLTYNGGCACQPGEETLPTFRTTLPDTDVLVQFDESTGLVRAIVGGVTPVLGTSWGELKARYR